jgi:hypothetical protein
VGSAFLATGVRSLLGAAADTHPVAAATWVVGLAIAHDLVLVPTVLLVGVAVRRLAPPAVRASLAAALLIAGCVSLIAWPLVRGYGRIAGNPSILPRDYGVGLGLVLAVVGTATVVGVLRQRRAARRGERSTIR